MKRWPLLVLSISTLALANCSMMSDDGGDLNTSATSTPTAAVSSPAQEEKELAAVMGGSSDGKRIIVSAEDDIAIEEAMAEDETMVTEVNVKEPKAKMVTGVPTECPSVEVLPDTKSITYFDGDGKPGNPTIARASLTDIRGGCEYSEEGVIVDIDMLMQGRINDIGRYEGRKDLEAFMTFPYFVAVMNPEGKMVDKKIMATAMRFKPNIDDLDHAEKITQMIPLNDLGAGPHYTITLGFQLNRQQLDYNRGQVSDAPNIKDMTKTESKPPVDDSETDAMSAPAPDTMGSAPSKMKPIEE